MTSLAQIRKFLGAATLAAGTAVSADLLSGTAEKWTTGVLAVATAAVVYLLPNGNQTTRHQA